MNVHPIIERALSSADHLWLPSHRGGGSASRRHMTNIMAVVGLAEAQDAELRNLKAENERLILSLKKANDLFEKYERQWYLACDEIEKMKADGNVISG